MKRAVFLSIGGNLGDRAGNLRQAVNLIGAQIGPVIGRSQIYETEAWGVHDQPAFLNACLKVETELEPLQVLEAANRIEAVLGRERVIRWHARTMDIDILYYGSEVIEHERLAVPHPQMAGRRFVLVPLSDLAGVPPHPLTGLTVGEMLAVCSDDLQATPCGAW